MAYNSGMFEIEVFGERSILENLNQMPDTVKRILREKLDYYAEEVKDQVIENIDVRLSKTAGTKEKEYSGAAGHLRDAVEVEYDEEAIEAHVYIDDSIPYARIQEGGGVIPPHLVLPRDGKVLAFEGALGGGKAIVTRVFNPGATITGVHYLRDAYRTLSPKIGREIRQAVIEGIREDMRNS